MQHSELQHQTNDGFRMQHSELLQTDYGFRMQHNELLQTNDAVDSEWSTMNYFKLTMDLECSRTL